MGLGPAEQHCKLCVHMSSCLYCTVQLSGLSRAFVDFFSVILLYFKQMTEGRRRRTHKNYVGNWLHLLKICISKSSQLRLIVGKFLELEFSIFISSSRSGQIMRPEKLPDCDLAVIDFDLFLCILIYA